MKLCVRCKENEATVQKNRWCTPCKRQYDRDYWAKTKALRNERKKLNSASIRLRNRQFIWNYYLEHSCVDCGINDPRVLQSDHQNDKSINISDMSTHSIAAIEKELAKCESRCANCHMIRTGEQFGWYAWMAADSL